jgi:hypothetical protein
MWMNVCGNHRLIRQAMGTQYFDSYQHQRVKNFLGYEFGITHSKAQLDNGLLRTL